MFTPYRRQKPEEEPAETAPEPSTGEETDAETATMTEEISSDGQLLSGEMNRSWYNMVCYGIPNLMVTQLSKP